MTACYCDYGDPAEFLSETRPIAKRQHRCSECGATISPGERYLRTFARWDGQVDTFKTCADCLAVWDAISSNKTCVCLTYGGQWEAIHEWLTGGCEPTNPGQWFGVARHYIDYRKRVERRRIEAKAEASE